MPLPALSLPRRRPPARAVAGCLCALALSGCDVRPRSPAAPTTHEFTTIRAPGATGAVYVLAVFWFV